MPNDKSKKKTKEQKEKDEESLSQGSSNMDDEHDAIANAKFDQILKELRDFRRDNKEQLHAMKEELSAIGGRMNEAEERIDSVETRIQSSEELLLELAQRHSQTELKLMELEGHSRRQNIRIYGVDEGAEDGSQSAINFIETLLEKGLGLPTPPAIERAHRALANKPPLGAPARSFVVKFASYRTKEEILRKAWQVKGFDFNGKRIYLDNDYAPEVQRRRKEYAAAKKVLRDNNIRFQTPFPFKLRVFYGEGTVIYNSAQEATEDMVQRGLPVSVIKKPASLLDKLKDQPWQVIGKRGKKSNATLQQNIKEKLQAYRHREDTG